MLKDLLIKWLSKFLLLDTWNYKQIKYATAAIHIKNEQKVGDCIVRLRTVSLNLMLCQVIRLLRWSQRSNPLEQCNSCHEEWRGRLRLCSMVFQESHVSVRVVLDYVLGILHRHGSWTRFLWSDCPSPAKIPHLLLSSDRTLYLKDLSGSLTWFLLSEALVW